MIASWHTNRFYSLYFACQHRDTRLCAQCDKKGKTFVAGYVRARDCAQKWLHSGKRQRAFTCARVAFGLSDGSGHQGFRSGAGLGDRERGSRWQLRSWRTRERRSLLDPKKRFNPSCFCTYLYVWAVPLIYISFAIQMGFFLEICSNWLCNRSN